MMIPDNVHLSDHALDACDSLEEVIIGSGVTLSNNLMDRCTNIKIVSIGIDIKFETEDHEITGTFEAYTFYDAEGTQLGEDVEKYEGRTFVMAANGFVELVFDNDDESNVMESDTDVIDISKEYLTYIKCKAESDPTITLDVTLKDRMNATFDNAAVKSLGDVAANLKMAIVPTSSLDDTVKNIVGDNPVFEITFGINTDFGDGKVTFTVPYTLPEGKDASYLKVYYIKDGAIAEKLDATYSNGTVTFITDHLSMYSIGYEVPPDDDGGFPVWAIVLIVVAVIAVAGGIGAYVFLQKKKVQ